MSDNLEGMFDHDIRMYMLAHDTPMDALAETIHRALRTALLANEHGSGFFRFADVPGGFTELEGEYDLAFCARVIRAALP